MIKILFVVLILFMIQVTRKMRLLEAHIISMDEEFRKDRLLK